MQNVNVFGVLIPIGVCLLLVGLAINNKEKILAWLKKNNPDFSWDQVPRPNVRFLGRIFVPIISIGVALMVGWFVIKEVKKTLDETVIAPSISGNVSSIQEVITGGGFTGIFTIMIMGLVGITIIRTMFRFRRGGEF